MIHLGPSSSGRELTLPQLSGSRAPKTGVKTRVPASGPGFPIQSLQGGLYRHLQQVPRRR